MLQNIRSTHVACLRSNAVRSAVNRGKENVNGVVNGRVGASDRGKLREAIREPDLGLSKSFSDSGFCCVGFKERSARFIVRQERGGSGAPGGGAGPCDRSCCVGQVLGPHPTTGVFGPAAAAAAAATAGPKDGLGNAAAVAAGNGGGSTVLDQKVWFRPLRTSTSLPTTRTSTNPWGTRIRAGPTACTSSYLIRSGNSKE
uniref:Uncharacterized protein n=1 Tax=Ananas comosus var. bracteatus TaxID=296719 RepID=A0A6V7QPH5_ANACO|nr:unnamed protein product [Ananas comosus var. bracteatus]